MKDLSVPWQIFRALYALAAKVKCTCWVVLFVSATNQAASAAYLSLLFVQNSIILSLSNFGYE